MLRGFKRLDGAPRNAISRKGGWRISTVPCFGVKWTDGRLARQADFLR
jgi:hypothetical protein